MSETAADRERAEFRADLAEIIDTDRAVLEALAEGPLGSPLERVVMALVTGWLPDGDSVGQNTPTVMFGERIAKEAVRAQSMTSNMADSRPFHDVEPSNTGSEREEQQAPGSTPESLRRAEEAIDAALRTTWTEDDEGGWGDENDTLHPDRWAALAALQPFWQQWGDQAWGVAGRATEAPGATPESLRRMLDYVTSPQEGEHVVEWDALSPAEQQAITRAYEGTP